MRRIITLSKILERFFQILIVLSFMMSVIIWTYGDFKAGKVLLGFNIIPFEVIGLSKLIHHSILGEITPLMRFLGFLVSLIPTTLQIVIYWQLKNLFSLYRHQQFFAAQNVLCIRWIALALLIKEALSPVYEMLMSLALTMNNPPGQRMISISFGSNNIEIIVTALVILVIAWIMDEARKLEEDKRLTI